MIFLRVFPIPRVFRSDPDDRSRVTDSDAAGLHTVYGPGRVSLYQYFAT